MEYPPKRPATPPSESIRAAKVARLVYVSDRDPGIERKGRPGRFHYRRPKGGGVRDVATLKRIAGLVIPPAWSEVWICLRPDGHIQAVGRDARGRKQYRYHSRWRAVRDGDKYDHMIDFARALPRLRRRVAADLRLPGLPREKILATIVRLLESTLIRVGNDEYAEENKSYGLTTIRNGHARVRGSRVEFSFRGKSGKSHQVQIDDPKLARIIRRCQDLPGQRLFEYLDGEGKIGVIGSHDVNLYLAAASGQECTAKDFRTWIGTVLATMAFGKVGVADSPAEAKRRTAVVVESVAGMLRNTPAVCRKCYIHPEVMAAYLEGEIPAFISNASLRKREAALITWLRQRMKRSGFQKGKAPAK
ncbi:DNA topoisomerase-1 [Verrucomicrobium sp. GAS474]|uniref:DNA topoisomerase IB n=1 Tax=Verrucomicrobium sp. GAS474 TaxID=1882831 RepID=UPI00087C9BB9|nr:DNA topoisomerase IB [Verrucomicrobium sp. GAS474]SDU12086.1 DNA topoisomerase-1 [Verrucomicrobium sp. GAS474]